MDLLRGLGRILLDASCEPAPSVGVVGSLGEQAGGRGEWILVLDHRECTTIRQPQMFRTNQDDQSLVSLQGERKPFETNHQT